MESKQARPKATEKKQESGSAFEQEGKGKTMAAPAFGLMASGDSASAAKPKSGDPIRDTFYEIIEQGRYDPVYFINGARYLMTKFGWYKPELMDLKVVDALPKGDVAYTRGVLGPDEIQTIWVKKSTFSEDYTFIVRALGHEYQHCLYHWSHSQENYDQHESEFESYYWEIFGVGCPTHAIADNQMDSIEYAVSNFNRMPKSLKTKHEPQFNELVSKKKELAGSTGR